MSKVLLVMIGGSLGALSRYLVTLLSARHLGTAYPWGTLFVNLGGCFLIGLAFALSERNLWVGPATRLFFMTGYLGAMTTFSTFGLETVNAAKAGGQALAMINFMAHNVGGLLCVLAGMGLARLAR
ncbi:MAG: fluoride efflux transporter CrcB [Lentisphaerae bacterium]|nr:fluoride efflux transporter CrcB [Lentisphaerota bacterium]